MTNRRVIGSILLLLLLIVGFWLGLFMKLLRSRNDNPPTGPQLLTMFFNVGDGDSALIHSPNGLSILIDSGPDESAAREVITHMRLMQGGPPELIVLTSARNRSVGGIPYILAHTAFHGVIVLPCTAEKFGQFGGSSARNALSAAERQHIQVMSWNEFQSSKSQVLNSDPSAQATLIPVAEPLSTLSQELRETGALAVRVDYGSSALVYTAGLLPAEESMLVASRAHLPCDIIAATDGASKSSLSYELLALAAPRIAATSTSPTSSIDADVEERLNAANVKIDRTDLLGTFTLGLSQQADAPIAFYGPQSNLPVER